MIKRSFIILTVITPLLFVSCGGSDTTETAQKIARRWKLTDIHSPTIDEAPPEWQQHLKDTLHKATWVLLGDGNIKVEDSSKIVRRSGTWQIVGDTLVTNYSASSDRTAAVAKQVILELTNERMMLKTVTGVPNVTTTYVPAE